MVQQNVDETILNSMGSLDGLLSERGYTTATVPMQGESVVRNEFGTGPVTAPGPADYATHGVVPQPASGVETPNGLPAQPASVPQQPAQPQVSVEQYHAAMAYAARMQAAAQEAAREKLEAEDRLFLQSIADLSEMEQNAAILYRHNQQLQAANQGLSETLQQQQQREEEEEQAEAKHGVAMVLAFRNGLPWENPGVQAALLAAPDRATMDQIVTGLKAALPQPAAQYGQQNPAQIAAQQIVGAPARGSNGAAPASGPKPGSGDIAGLLKSRPYQVGSQ